MTYAWRSSHSTVVSDIHHLMSLSKVSIILLYMRLFPGKRFAVSCWATMYLVVAFAFGVCLGFMLMCTPINAFREKSIMMPCVLTGKLSTSPVPAS
jgi:hypothetical protein